MQEKGARFLLQETDNLKAVHRLMIIKAVIQDSKQIAWAGGASPPGILNPIAAPLLVSSLFLIDSGPDRRQASLNLCIEQIGRS